MIRKYSLNNKSQSHVEVIISFSLFLGFVTILFLFLNPFQQKEEKESEIDFIQKKLFEEISQRIGILSIIVETDNGCYDLSGVDYGNKYVVIKESPRKYTAYFSNYFELGEDLSCDGGYFLGVYRKEKVIFYDDIKEFAIDYHNNRGQLQDQLGIKDNFWFNFRYINNTQILELTPSEVKSPIGINKESKDYPTIIMDNNAKRYEVIMNLRTW
jgi:hypothetical protein